MECLDNREAIIEELANSITHGIGLALSLAGFVVLVILAALNGSAWHIAGCSVFGATLVFLYAASTLYHSFRNPRVKQIFKVADHVGIYLLIAGTYTPFTLVNLRGFWGWTLFAMVWGLSLFGILLVVSNVNRFKVVSVLLYLLMGWMAVIAIKPILAAVPLNGIIWLLAGGLFYTIGVVFFACKRVPYNHTIWHGFVMAGSICHYFAVMFYVLP